MTRIFIAFLLMISLVYATPREITGKDIPFQTWYNLETKSTTSSSALFSTFIMKILPGWILFCSDSYIGEGGPVFIPDPNHEMKWTIE